MDFFVGFRTIEDLKNTGGEVPKEYVDRNDELTRIKAVFCIGSLGTEKSKLKSPIV